MTFDPHKNFAYSTVATAPSPASSGTSLTLQSGDGALFPQPSTDGAFNLTVWPAGAAPVASNAEIVRCTARSGDTLTIARTQEGTSARSILTGDQIALTITAKLLTDIEDPSVILVPAATGVAATDTAAIQAAIDACPDGGVVQLAATGSSGYALTGSPALTIDKSIALRGRGGSQIGLDPTPVWSEFGTLLTYDSATGVAIQVQSDNVRLENFALQNTHATAPTAGAGIQTVTGGGNGTRYGPNLSTRGHYINIDHQAGNAWVMDPTCISLDFILYGLKIQNVDNADAGDSTVSGFFYAGPTNSGDSAIAWFSGGGIKAHNIKVNCFLGKTLTCGIRMQLLDGVSTSDFLLTNSSIEGAKFGFVLAHQGPSNTGQFNNIVINGNQFAHSVSAAQAIAIAPAVTSKVARVYVGGNVMRNTGGGTSAGVEFKNIDNATHGPNVFDGWTNNFLSSGTNTNITSVGAG